MAEGTDFLYPFIEGGERDAGALLTDLARSAMGKAETSATLRAATLEASSAELQAAAGAMAGAFAAGARLFTFGNGGSSTDAATLAALFARPPWGLALPARCLVDDTAVVTALGNDVGFELVFSRQLIAHARAGDIALGVSTSGTSRNVLDRARAGPRAWAAHGRSGWLRRRRDGRHGFLAPLPCRALGQRAPHPGDAGCARVPALDGASSGGPVEVDIMSDAADREATVLDRIGAFRRRRPRLTDDVVTMAHGAGGKASAALVDAVFVEAFGGGSAPLADAATLALPTGERLAFTTDSFVVQPHRFPGRLDRAPRGARDGERSRRDGRPPGVAGGRLRHRGGVPGGRAAGGRRGHGGCRGSRRGRHRHR